MRILLAPPGSFVARVARSSPDTVHLLTAGDLSRTGWVLDPANPLEGRAVIGGRTISNADIERVVIAMPAIGGLDLPDVVRADRDFVASEMTAFLRTWLTTLGAAVAVTPTPTSLAGPMGDFSFWRHAAAGAGLPICGRPVGFGSHVSTVVVPVVRGVALGRFPPAAEAYALALADAAGATVCTPRLSLTTAGARLAGVPFWWDAAPRQTLARLLEGRP